MNALKNGFKAFSQELRKTKWTTLNQKSDLMKEGVPIDFDFVMIQNEELMKILNKIPPQKRSIVFTAWKESWNINTNNAKQKYIEKYKPSLITFGVSFGLSTYMTILMGPGGGLVFPYVFPFFFSISYGSQQVYRTIELKDAYKKSNSTNFLCETIELDDDIIKKD